MPPKVDRGKRKATEAEVEAQEHVAGREIESRTTRDVAASSEQQAIEEQQSPQSVSLSLVSSFKCKPL